MAPESGGIAEKEVIKWHWQTWDKLIKDWGWEDEDLPLEEYGFVVDRRSDELSFFTADRIDVMRLNIPLEEFTNTPSMFRSQKGEKWIIFQIDPKNPYKPYLAFSL